MTNSTNLIDALYLGHITPSEFLKRVGSFDEFLETECTTKDDLLCILQAFEESEFSGHIKRIRQSLNNK